jgi:hypothetical protein
VIPSKQTKRATGTVGQGVAAKKTKTTQHAGGQSVSEKSQAKRTSKNVFQKSNSPAKPLQTRGVSFLCHHPMNPSNAYTRVKQVSLDTDPLMWWKKHVQEFHHLARMTRQHLAVPANSASPERLFSSVGLVKSDLWGSLLDTILIDVMWTKQAS